MEKNITVDELIKNYSALSSNNVKEEYIKRNIKVIDYLDVSVIDIIATSIINATSFDDNKNLSIDSLKRYILTVFAYFDNCTNIKVDSNLWIVQYDRLKSYGLLDIIIKMIPEDVVLDIDTAIHMKYDDMIVNYQMKRYDKIAMIPESFIIGINKMFEEYGEILKNVDWNRIAENK